MQNNAATAPTLPEMGLRVARLLGRGLLYLMQALAITGCTVIPLMAFIAVANAVLGPTPIPDNLKNFATATHLLLLFVSLPLSVVQLIARKGSANHRRLGYIWAALMLLGSLLGFGIYGVNGEFSSAHVLAALSLVFVPLIVFLARWKLPLLHRIGVLCYILYFQVGAGAATFLPHRALGTMFWPLWQ